MRNLQAFFGAASRCLTLLLAASSFAHAQTSPDAGALLRESERQPRALPQPGPQAVPQAPLQMPADGARVVVKGFRLTGNTLIPEAELQTVVQPWIGREAGLGEPGLRFFASDLEGLQGRFDTVVCLDVFIHYPQAAAEEMVRHLAGLAERHLIVSFAPYTPLLALLKGIGQLFPGPSRTTRAYTLREEGIVTAAAAVGFRPVRRSLNQAPFYFSRLIAFERG